MPCCYELEENGGRMAEIDDDAVLEDGTPCIECGRIVGVEAHEYDCAYWEA